MSDLIDRQAAIAEFSCCQLTPDGGIDANYAIDFLKQLPSAQPDVPDTNVGDMISRKAAIALAKDICVPIKDGTVYKHRCIDPDAIKDLPSVGCNVIYCKDCLFYSGHRCQATRSLDDWRSQYDYCSRAERM